MQLSYIAAIFFGKTAQAICWMLVHSLWMGLLLTVITGIIMLATKKRTAVLRYNLLSISLLLFTVAVISLFAVQATTGSNMFNEDVAASTAAVISNTTSIDSNTNTENKITLAAKITGFLNNYAIAIAAVWLMVILLRSIKMAGGLLTIKKMKTSGLSPVAVKWNEKLQHFSTLLHIKNEVRFFESGIAKIPMVLGHFKPVILFPIGLLLALPAAEAEAVLLHELAHIRRKDYLVNMLQHFTEIVFFFNPAVLWISALIKIERENCCDDLALTVAGSKRNYINALVSFQEYHLQAPRYASTLAGNKKHLLQRVKRILYNNNKTLNAMEKTFLTLCFFITVSLAVFFTQSGVAQNKGTGTVIATNDTTGFIANRYYNPADFTEGSSTGYTEKINGVVHTLYIFKREGVLYEIYDDMTSFKIDGKKIPQEEWGKHKELISRLKKEYAESQALASATTAADINVQQKELLMLRDKLYAEKQQLENDKVKLQLEQLQMMGAQDINQSDTGKYFLSLQQQKLQAEQQLLLANKNALVMEQQYNQDKTKMMEKLQAEINQQKNGYFKIGEQMQELQKMKAAAGLLVLQKNKLQLQQAIKEKELMNLQKEDLMKQQFKMKAAQEMLLLQKDKLKTDQDMKLLLLEKQQAEREQQEQVRQKKEDEKKDREVKKQEMKEKQEEEKEIIDEKKVQDKEERNDHQRVNNEVRLSIDISPADHSKEESRGRLENKSEVKKPVKTSMDMLVKKQVPVAI